MRQSRLYTANFESEHWEHAHSPTVVSILDQAFDYLALRRFQDAEHVVMPYLSWPMSLGQRLRLLFIRANAAHQREDYQQAAILLEEAISICTDLEGQGELAQLALVSAEAHHALQEFSQAARIAGKGLDAWTGLARSTDPADITMEIDLRDRYSLELFLVGHYDDALKQCYKASALTRSQAASRETALAAAALDWTLALLHRWHGNYKLARQHVLAALPIYIQWGHPDELARLRVVVADISLDLIMPVGTGIPRHYREDLLAQARLCLAQALGAMTDDPAGMCMAELAEARLSRALAMNEDRVAKLESLGQVAEQLHDLPLLAQVYTALGDEFGSSGEAERESQFNCYRRALGVAEASQAPAYSVWARRGLLLEAEFAP